MNLTFSQVGISLPEGCNIIVGQAHFIKTVEDIAEIVVTTSSGGEYGLAFCEASGPCLVRKEGNNKDLIKEAARMALEAAAGHTFFLILKNIYPINILNQIKACQEVAGIFAATANPLQLIIAETEQGRGILGVIDGFSPKGEENDEEAALRKDFLKKIGYKF